MTQACGTPTATAIAFLTAGLGAQGGGHTSPLSDEPNGSIRRNTWKEDKVGVRKDGRMGVKLFYRIVEELSKKTHEQGSCTDDQ